VENGKEATAAIVPESAQNRDQAKRNSPRLITVIHIMQNNVIEFGARQSTCSCALEGPNLESIRIRNAGRVTGGKDRFATKEETEFPRDRQSVVPHSIERPRRPRHDLKNGFQLNETTLGGRSSNMNQGSGKKTAVIDLIGQIGRTDPNFLCGTTSDDAAFRDVFGNDRARRDDTAPANDDSRQNQRSRADENVISNADRPFPSREARALRIMIGRQDAGIGGDGNVAANFQTAAIIEPATLVDRGMIAQFEVPSRIKLSAHKNEGALPDIEAHDRAVKPEPHGVTGKMRDQVITNKHDAIEPEPAQKRTRHQRSSD
jgi:hypothetical protein